MEEREAPTVAGAPFDDPEADIILRSGGDSTVDFRTFKRYLMTASPVFKGMISLPTHPPNNSPPEITVVQMQEGERDLVSLLLFCHPGTLPDLPTTLNELYRLGRIADKYMLESAITLLKTLSRPILTKEPVGGYLLARKLQWKEEAEFAARLSLAWSIDRIISWNNHPILYEVPVTSFQDLLSYHRACSNMISFFMTAEIWKQRWHGLDMEPESVIDFSALVEYDDTDFCCSLETIYRDDEPLYTKKWWETFTSELSKGLAVTPSFEEVATPLRFRAALAEAGECDNCRLLALEQLHRFLHYAKKLTMERVEQIKIPT
ncbi:hypothetical protein QCA50_009084 [Cerrena zonata]|uniref:BTB domain-containing protein n=1 Tax=Cerrena zonata TaxID=2478898 RepID=A0AAW0GFR6_9APHY